MTKTITAVVVLLLVGITIALTRHTADAQVTICLWPRTCLNTPVPSPLPVVHIKK